LTVLTNPIYDPKAPLRYLRICHLSEYSSSKKKKVKRPDTGTGGGEKTCVVISVSIGTGL
jgi:hypothetical protein